MSAMSSEEEVKILEDQIEIAYVQGVEWVTRGNPERARMYFRQTVKLQTQLWKLQTEAGAK
jgi:hypothetical protein